MAQRESGYTRIDRDAYNTPRWATEAALREIMGTRFHAGMRVLEPAAGTGQMVQPLCDAGFDVTTADIEHSICPLNYCADFLQADASTYEEFDAIFTNPPYKHADAFVRRALELTRERRGMVAMLLGAKFDSGKSRSDIFNDCPAWGMKITLVDRIWWFDPEVDENGKINGPSEDHAWYVWDWRGSLGRSLRYASAPDSVLNDLRRTKQNLLREYKQKLAVAA